MEFKMSWTFRERPVLVRSFDLMSETADDDKT